jgi:hypothetical protein
MFRRQPPSPPPGPLGRRDLEDEPRPPLISRRHVLLAAALFLGGIAWGAVLRFAVSLPVDAGFLALVGVGVGFAFVLALAIALIFRAYEVGRVVLASFFAITGAAIGLSLGPTVASPVVVAGVFSFVPSVPADLPPTEGGDLECEWASGRWKIAELRTAPLDGFHPPAHLTIDFLRRTMSLTDDEASTLVAIGNDAFVAPPDAPPRGEGDRGGVLDLTLLQVNPASTPEDPVEVQARFSWDCPASPPG